MGASDLEQIDALIEHLSPEAKLVALTLRQLTKQQSEQLAKQTELIAKLTAQVESLRRMLFGPRSERMPTIDEELRKQGPQPEVTVGGEPMPTDDKKRKRELRRHARRKSEVKREANKQARKELPTHDVEVPVRAEQLPEGMTLDEFRIVGEGTIVERIDYVPGRYVRLRYILETLASKDGEHIIRATPPPGVGKAVKYGPGIHANVVAAKCGDAMPLYRIAKRLGRAGISTARSTLCAMFHRSAETLTPIYDRLLEEVERRGLGPALAAEAGETAFGSLGSPGRQVRRVQALASQQGSDLAVVFAAVGFGEDAALVLGGERAALALGEDFGVGLGSHGLGRRHRSSRSCPLL